MKITYKNLIKLPPKPHKQAPKPVKGCVECMCGQSALNLIHIRSIYDHFSINFHFVLKLLKNKVWETDKKQFSLKWHVELPFLTLLKSKIGSATPHLGIEFY